MGADLLLRDVFAIAALIRSGEASAREVMQLALDRIADADPRINAFAEVRDDLALDAAGAVRPGDERPFAGVPIAIKDLRAVDGYRLTAGMRFAGDFRPGFDHAVVRRLKEAGFVVAGITTTPEIGIPPVTRSARFGVTRNPWDPERTAGGSSGGAAAAVAAGMVPIAHAMDGGGSTRIPASCCGLVGLKPQRGRVSAAPDPGFNLLVQDGVVTRTVAETAALLDVLAGPELGDPAWAPPPAEPFADAARRDPGRLRIAVTTLPPLEVEVHEACAGAARDAAALLAGLGHELEETEPPWRRPGLMDAFTAVYAPMIAAPLALAGMAAGREPAEGDVEALTWYLWTTARRMTSLDAALAESQLLLHAREILVWAGRYDAVLLPTLAQPPLLHDELDPDAPDAMDTMRRSGRFSPFTPLANVGGQPAISLPLGAWEGVPIGVQLFGRPAQEGTLLALAAQVEAAAPWADRVASTAAAG